VKVLSSSPSTEKNKETENEEWGQCLPTICKAFCLIPSTTRKKEKKDNIGKCLQCITNKEFRFQNTKYKVITILSFFFFKEILIKVWAQKVIVGWL
jgi:hypothetical protein